ncbi:MAG TPA: chemotaxis protein CheR [Rhodospirillaceae bacterium]|nr:MAG: chemotaxis protein CheR [Alphaproteobacteria bacterium GWF2_58_20]HAU28954.1 chemotaxis protein CheR [Rhodospirillaceae bacterium]
MTPQAIDVFSKFVKQASGLVLTPDKAYLLESRLFPVIRRYGLESLDILAEHLLKPIPDARLARDVMEAMTTNETSFFRDTRPFDQFRDVLLPKFLEKRAAQRHIRIWCAAASCGQEPYSLAMILHEKAAELAGWRIDILATDISSEMITKAQNGLYSQFEVQRGLPVKYLVKHFQQEGDRWKLSQDILKMAKFQTFNLLQDFTHFGQFDIIYCRNVLIYFDQPTKENVLRRMGRTLTSDGTLCLGGAETVLGIAEWFKPLDGQRGIYVLNPDSPAMATLGGAYHA